MAHQTPKIRVWDLGVRLFHWSLVVMVVTTYFTVDFRTLHRGLGYVVAALIAFRLIWGLIGGPHARFASFMPSPRHLLHYLRAMLAGVEPRYLGHNPAGAVMIVALLCTLTGVSVTGYMMGMTAYFGQDWVEQLHGTLVTLLLVLLVGHIGGVIYSSWKHRENLVRAMVTGQKDVNVGTP